SLPLQSSEHFWISRAQRARDYARGFILDVMGRSKIREHRAPARFAQDVFGLDIAVNQPVPMDTGECCAEVHGKRPSVLDRHRSSRNASGEGFPPHKLHPDSHTIAIKCYAIDRRNVGVSHTGLPTCFRDKLMR